MWGIPHLFQSSAGTNRKDRDEGNVKLKTSLRGCKQSTHIHARCSLEEYSPSQVGVMGLRAGSGFLLRVSKQAMWHYFKGFVSFNPVSSPPHTF